MQTGDETLMELTARAEFAFTAPYANARNPETKDWYRRRFDITAFVVASSVLCAWIQSPTDPPMVSRPIVDVAGPVTKPGVALSLDTTHSG